MGLFGIMIGVEELSHAKINPLNVAVETNFYTSEGIDAKNPAIMEDFLAEHVEEPFWPVLDKLERMQIPTETERDRIIVFAAFLFTRVSAFREAITKVLADVTLRYKNGCAATNPLDSSSKKTSPDFIPAMIPKNYALHQMGRIGIEASKILMTFNTHVMFSAPNEPFITSDNPFVFDQIVKHDEPPSISAKSFMKWVPLSAKVAVGFGLPGNHIFFSNMDEKQVRNANVRFATAARQIVIARSREQLEKLLAALPKDVPKPASGFPSAV
jgi:hypothetical protein